MDGNCSEAALTSFSKEMAWLMLRVNALLIGNTILMGIMVGIGAYAHRYRHHPLTRFLFLGANALFIPIASYVVSTTVNQRVISILCNEKEIITGICSPSKVHFRLVLIWTGLVQIIGISTTAVVAADAKEGRHIGPPALLLVQAIWPTYLAVNVIKTIANPTKLLDLKKRFSFYLLNGLFFLSPFALVIAKFVFKFYAFYKAQRSLALGSNPRLIVGYMKRLQDGSQHAEAELICEHIPPPLIVMGEETVQVDKQPHGYCFNGMSEQGDRTRMNNNGLVTIDKVWRLDDNLLRSIPQLKDVCFSFASFKLLRCRFAKYTAAEVKLMNVHNFFWQVLLKDSDDERVLGVTADELSFLHDHYYSSLAISYSRCWLPILSIFISILSIVYCLFATTLIALLTKGLIRIEQTSCDLQCGAAYYEQVSSNIQESFGSIMFDLVPVLLLLLLIVLAEARDIASYICSNLTKVSLICRYASNASWQQSPTMRKWVGRVLNCRCKLVKPWKDKMNQCSILVLRPRKTLMALLRRLTSLPEQKKNIKVPRAVKAAIIDTLRSSQGCLRNNLTSLCQSTQIGDNLLWASNGRGISDILLVWHIATGIFEVRHPHSSASDHKIAATHLSRYCAYLVALSPELLPDDDEWSKSLYKAVKKDAERVLAGRVAVSTPDAEYQQLVELLSARSKHEVLKNGARLGKQLVDEMEDEETAWKVLAGFWSETILYIAPSDNLDGHAQAIAQGGELITLLWALLTHVGIVSRADATAAAAANAGGAAVV